MERGKFESAKENVLLDVFSGVYELPISQVRVLRTKYGDVSLASDSGFGGKRNEDRVFLDTERSIFGVVDGIGGYERGDEAAEIVSKTILAESVKGTDAHLVNARASSAMRMNGIFNGGACYLYFTVEKKQITAFWAGDARLIVLNESGEIMFSSRPTSLEKAPRGNFVGSVTSEVSDIMNGYIAIAATDGLWDNIDVSEIQKRVAGLRSGETDILLKELYQRARQGMESGFETNYGDPARELVREHGKPDNLGIVVFQKLIREKSK